MESTLVNVLVHIGEVAAMAVLQLASHTIIAMSGVVGGKQKLVG